MQNKHYRSQSLEPTQSLEL